MVSLAGDLGAGFPESVKYRNASVAVEVWLGFAVSVGNGASESIATKLAKATGTSFSASLGFVEGRL